jgi:glucokinase
MMLTLGTGIGGALILGGELYQGRYNRAGHLGHITLNPQASSGIIALPGTLEYLVGNAYLAERSKGAFTDTAQLLQACRAGHTVAMKVWDESMYYLALGISSLINVISPERIVLGGGMLEAGHDLWNPLKRYLDQYEWRPFGVATPIIAAQLKVYAGAVGAAFYARQQQEL